MTRKSMCGVASVLPVLGIYLYLIEGILDQEIYLDILEEPMVHSADYNNCNILCIKEEMLEKHQK
jgi:hypothetical protein